MFQLEYNSLLSFSLSLLNESAWPSCPPTMCVWEAETVCPALELTVGYVRVTFKYVRITDCICCLFLSLSRYLSRSLKLAYDFWIYHHFYSSLARFTWPLFGCSIRFFFVSCILYLPTSKPATDVLPHSLCNTHFRVAKEGNSSYHHHRHASFSYITAKTKHSCQLCLR